MNNAGKLAIVNSLKRELVRTESWNDVQDDVKARLEWIVNRIDKVGTLFARSYMTLFRWEYERRKLEGKHLKNPLTGYLSTLLGMQITEEAFQCGSVPTRAILSLYDYVEPNDADVTACLFLCNKIEILEKMGALKHDNSEWKINSSEIAELRKNPKPALPKRSEEKLTWDFPDKDEKNN